MAAPTCRGSKSIKTRARSVSWPPDFEAPQDAGGINTYQIIVTAIDSTLNSSRAVTLSVTNVPTNGSVTGLPAGDSFLQNTINTNPKILASGAILAADDAPAGGTLTVSGLLPEDRISIASQGFQPGQIGNHYGDIYYGLVQIGTASGGEGNDLTVALNGSVTIDAITALLRQLTYANASATPAASRTLRIDITDKYGNHSPLVPSFGAFASNPIAGVTAGLQSAPSFVDLGNNGTVDLVIGRQDGGFDVWQPGGGGYVQLTGTANPLGSISAGAGNQARPAFVDLNRDGQLDLVSGGVDGNLQVWYSTPAGFIAATGTANPFNGIDIGVASAPAFADLDGDGIPDLVVGSFDGGLLTWLNTGSGFIAQTGTANPFNGLALPSYRSTPVFVDLDGDKRPDLVVGDRFGGLQAWINTGSGFTRLTGAADPFAGVTVPDFASPAFADLDGDGKVDLALGGDGLTAWQNTSLPLAAIPVIVIAQPQAAVFTSGGSVSVPEYTTGTVYQATATTTFGSISWSLDGTDAALFSIDADGAVSSRPRTMRRRRIRAATINTTSPSSLRLAGSSRPSPSPST